MKTENLLNGKKKQLLKQQIRAIKKADDMSKGAKVALIILSVLLAIGLLYAVAAIACGLSCNGSGGAAILVGVLEAGLVIFLLFIAIRGITGKKRKREKKEAEPDKTGKRSKKQRPANS